MTDQVRCNPEMLTLARESAGLSQTGLADLTPYDQSNISRMESGQTAISQDAANCFAKVLNRPLSFFMQHDRIYGLGSSFLYHRKRQSMNVGDLRKVEADANIIRIQLSNLLRGVELSHEFDFVPMDVGIDGTPEEIANLLRAAWRLPSGPIRNLSAAVENACGFIVYYKYHVPTVDGVHLWVTGLPPLFVLNRNMPGDRIRWTLSHEIGHAIMHRHPSQDIETEADRFASEFLMPARDIFEDLRDLTLAKAATLKVHWLVSIQALIRRARDLGAITEGKYKSLYVQLSKSGFRKKEPVEIKTEQVLNIRRLIEMHLNVNRYTLESLSELARATPESFQNDFLVDAESTTLRLVR